MKRLTGWAWLLCVLLAAAFPLTANAAQSSKTLQAGRVYEFTGKDSRLVTYVAVSSTARYEYVVLDEDGNVADFGISTGRFPVKGGGSTFVSLMAGQASASAAYDTNQVAVFDASGSALARVNLTQGETVKITNTRTASSVMSIDNTGRNQYAQYDCVIFDRVGEVSFIMDDSRYTSITLPEAGLGSFTAGEGGLVLIYPAVWAGKEITVQPSERTALTAIPIIYGKTYTLVNKNVSTDCTVGVTGGKEITYDYIREDAWGYTVDYGHAARGSRITAEADSRLYISLPEQTTEVPAEEIKLIYPSDWADYLSVTEGGPGALVSFTTEAGETLTIINESPSKSFAFKADQSAPVSSLDYTYSGGAYGASDYVVGEDFNTMTVDAGYTWTFTVKKGPALTLWLPAAWLDEGIRITGGTTNALSAYTLLPGRSLRLENTDKVNDYVISIAGAQPGHEPVYDYVITDGAEIRYEAECKNTTLLLPPGAFMTVTAEKSQPLAVRLPAANAVTAVETPEQAIVRYDLAVGESALFANGASLQAFDLLLQGAPTAKAAVMDFVLKNDKKQVVDFGNAEVGTAITVEAGGNALLTNTDMRVMTVIYPSAWQKEGLSVAKTKDPALYRQKLTENKAMDIVNLDKKYDFIIAIEAIPGATVPVKCDYLLKNSRLQVTDYGVNGEGRLTLLGGGKAFVMPQKGVTLTVCYPYEWQDKKIKMSASVNQPLYRQIIKPGQRLRLDNRTGNARVYQTESGQFYVRYNDDQQRITASEHTLSGDLTLNANESVIVIAAPGADVEIVMPREWNK